MSDLETLLRETLDRVAGTTKVNRRVDEIVQARSRRPLPRFTIGVAAFAVVAAVFAVPMLLGDSPTNNVAGDLSAPTDVAGNSSAPMDGPVTIDPDWLTVDPDDLTAFSEIPLPGNGERAPLRSETIWCFYEDARPIETNVTGIAVDEPVTADALTATCATTTDSATELELSSDSMTVCRGVFDAAAYEEWASSDEMTVISGGVAGSHPGFPVILGWKSDCISESLTSNPKVTLTDDLSLDAVNRARQLELAAVGAAIQNCLSYEESQALANAVVGELGQRWIHASLRGSDELAGACFQPFIDHQWGWVLNGLVRGERLAPVTEPTLAPSSP